MNEIEKKELEEYVDEFAELLKQRLLEKAEKYGDTWRRRGIWWKPAGNWGLALDHQVTRFIVWLNARYGQWQNEMFRKECEADDKGEPFNWLDVAGEALIGWVRQEKTGWEIKDE